jgi:uncharacterized protein
MKFFWIIAAIWLNLQALQTGQPLPSLTLGAAEGGTTEGAAFSSDTLKNRVYVIFYVDPDEKDLNNPFSDALKAEGFDRSRFASVAIINMDATWLPNFALESALKKKQKEFPHTLYVKDLHKKGIKTWQIADDNSDIIIIDKEGKVLYLHEGKVPESSFATIITLIKENL